MVTTRRGTDTSKTKPKEKVKRFAHCSRHPGALRGRTKCAACMMGGHTAESWRKFTDKLITKGLACPRRSTGGRAPRHAVIRRDTIRRKAHPRAQPSGLIDHRCEIAKKTTSI